MDERSLVGRILDGDAAAERKLYDAHVDRIFRLAYRLTGDDALAQDLTQETFVRAFDRLPGFEFRSALGTWLHAIAVSVVMTGLRKVKRIRGREVVPEELPPTAASAPDPGLGLALETAIDELPEGLRLVLLLHDVEGYKHREIAEILGVPAGTSKSRLNHARRRVRERLDPAGRRGREEGAG